MPTLNIKDPHVHEMAKELSERTGQSMTEVVRNALETSIQLERRKADKERLLARAKEISRRIGAMPDRDPRSPEEILGYNEYGVPE